MRNDEMGTTRLRDAILQYIQRNPNAADTLRGLYAGTAARRRRLPGRKAGKSK